MDLTSCDGCGVVLDKDKLAFPYNIYKDDGEVDDNLAVWDGDTFISKVPCPVCEHPITNPGWAGP